MDGCKRLNKLNMSDEDIIVALQNMRDKNADQAFVLTKAIASLKAWNDVLKEIYDEIEEITKHTVPTDVEAQDIIFDYKQIRKIILEKLSEAEL